MDNASRRSPGSEMQMYPLWEQRKRRRGIKSSKCGVRNSQGGESVPCVLDHPGHLLCRAAHRRDNEITFVLARLVVHHNDKFSARYGCNGALHCVKCKGGTEGWCTLFWCSSGWRRKIEDRSHGSNGDIRRWDGDCILLEDGDGCHDCRRRQDSTGHQVVVKYHTCT